MAKGRRTEIDGMNGFIAAKARKVGLAAPAREALAAIVKQGERGELPACPETLFHLATLGAAS